MDRAKKSDFVEYMDAKELIFNTVRLEFLKELESVKSGVSKDEAFDGLEPVSWLEAKLAQFDAETVCGTELTAHFRKKLHHLLGIKKFEHYF